MRILGIDPGTATTGYGLVSYTAGRPTAEDFGCIITNKKLTPSQRLSLLYNHMLELIDSTQPDIASVEKIFFNTNITTGMAVSQARGVILLALEQRGVALAEYTPLQVKMAVCGYGLAKKPQVQQMTQALLRLTSKPKPDDAADALALALCHSNASAVLEASK